ncbi:MAG: DUF5686 and carboxypeptidase regulatory-like domain-containing protein [Flavobacteriaceae bacterium]|nr:DUF5686 and carboxypeptidase regulatory-like domain-containing protein [Flavobacteriaceae bacterium]
MRLRNLIIVLSLVWSTFSLAQTKVSGKVIDENGEPVAFANVVFVNSTEGVITNEDGRFYIESDKRYQTLRVSFIGYTAQEIDLKKVVTYNLEVQLTSGQQLKEVVVYVGKQPKKNNPAVEILKKIWKRKRNNGLKQFKQYAYDKYEKVEFDLNTIDSATMKSRLFRGMEFVFNDLDTNRITGKTYLPFFINEEVSKVYGDNTNGKEREDLIGNRNSGFSNNQSIIAFVQDLYSDFNVYDNYLKFFDKSFVSPLSRTGVDVYNYVLNDSAFIDNKWCYNIVYYPRRKNELTFKGDFWVNDSTWAIKDINLQVTKSANINWVKEIYIEQEFEVLNDSLFLLKRDHMMSDFSLRKKEEARGIYGKRTTVYDNYVFDKPQPKGFYDKRVDPYDSNAFDKTDDFWAQNRLEDLNKDEKGIYTLLDTLMTVPKFKRMYNTVSILASGYIEFDKLNLDYGPIYSTFGYNDVEGLRLRVGGRTFFGQNDLWRIQGYTAYGLRDEKFKYGISGKWLIDKKNRIIISGGNRRDVEQTGVSLTATTDVLGRSFASSAFFASGDNSRLTNINLSTAAIELEPFKNVRFQTGASYKTMKSASPDTFVMDYIHPETGLRERELQQFEMHTGLYWTPGRRTSRYGVERQDVNSDYATIFLNYTKGVKGTLDSDFDYNKVQIYFKKPWQIGGFGRLTSTIEAGKTFGEVPLGLLSVVPGNQSYFSIYNTFSLLNYYEFITDTYTSLHLEHNFNGRLFSRIPLLRKLNLREIVAIRGVWGEISPENVAMNQPAFNSLTLNPQAIAPTDQVYWEYSFGIGNIFKVFRLDFNFRGNYFDNIDARNFNITGSFGFYF